MENYKKENLAREDYSDVKEDLVKILDKSIEIGEVEVIERNKNVTFMDSEGNEYAYRTILKYNDNYLVINLDYSEGDMEINGDINEAYLVIAIDSSLESAQSFTRENNKTEEKELSGYDDPTERRSVKELKMVLNAVFDLIVEHPEIKYIIADGDDEKRKRAYKYLIRYGFEERIEGEYVYRNF